MARNVVQFQKGLSEPAFEQQYGSEEQCREIVVASRWPNGFECPVCGEFVLHDGPAVRCPECEMTLRGRIESNVLQVEFGSQAG